MPRYYRPVMEPERDLDWNAYCRAFGGRLRHLRRAQGCSQEEIAYRAGIHVTYLSGIERGLRNPSLKNILALAAALDTPVAELFALGCANPPQSSLAEMDSRRALRPGGAVGPARIRVKFPRPNSATPRHPCPVPTAVIPPSPNRHSGASRNLGVADRLYLSPEQRIGTPTT